MVIRSSKCEFSLPNIRTLESWEGTLPVQFNVGRREGALLASVPEIELLLLVARTTLRQGRLVRLSAGIPPATPCFTSPGGKPGWEVRKPRVFAFSTGTSVGVWAVKAHSCR